MTYLETKLALKCLILLAPVLANNVVHHLKVFWPKRVLHTDTITGVQYNTDFTRTTDLQPLHIPYKQENRTCVALRSLLVAVQKRITTRVGGLVAKITTLQRYNFDTKYTNRIYTCQYAGLQKRCIRKAEGEFRI